MYRQPDNYLHVQGTFWSSEDIAAEADEGQQAAHSELLAEMEKEAETQVGGPRHSDKKQTTGLQVVL